MILEFFLPTIRDLGLMIRESRKSHCHGTRYTSFFPLPKTVQINDNSNMTLEDQISVATENESMTLENQISEYTSVIELRMDFVMEWDRK